MTTHARLCVVFRLPVYNMEVGFHDIVLRGCILDDLSDLPLVSWRGSDLADGPDWEIMFDANQWQAEDAQEQIFHNINKFGVVLIKGFPLLGKTSDQITSTLKNFIQRLGCPVSQSGKLDFIGKVTNLGSDISNHKSRGYESAAELPFHSDRCDLVSLLCVRQAPTGGLTRIVNAYTAYLELSKSDPSLSQALCQPIPFDLRDTNGKLRWAMMPVFSFEHGSFVSRYVRRFIEASQRFDDAPRLSHTQRAACDALDAILDAPGMSLDLRLSSGDWLLIDNHRMLHARTEFQDAENPAQARLLLRSWLSWPGSPELPRSYVPTYGRTEAGSFRGGVWPENRPLSSFPKDLRQAREALQELIA